MGLAGPPPKPASNEWETATGEFKQRCASIAITGPTGVGKTTLALSGQGPVALIHASEKIQGIVQPYVRKGKVIRLYNFGFAVRRKEEEKEIAKRAQEVWGKGEGLYYDAMDGWAKTVVWDTEPDAWTLRRLARFGTLTPQGDTRDLYNKVNFDWQQIFKNKPRETAKGRGCNLITIHTASDEYKDVIKNTPSGPKKQSVKTGGFKMDGQKNIKYWADVILWCDQGVDGKYMVRIDKPWWNGAFRGVEVTEEMLADMGYEVSEPHQTRITIPNILAMLTETEAGEWK